MTLGSVLHLPIYIGGDKGGALSGGSGEAMASVVSSDPCSLWMLRPCQPCYVPTRSLAWGLCEGPAQDPGPGSMRYTGLGTCRDQGAGQGPGCGEVRGFTPVGVVFLLS